MECVYSKKLLMDGFLMGLLLLTSCWGRPSLWSIKDIQDVLENHTLAIRKLNVFVRKNQYAHEWLSKNERLLDKMMKEKDSLVLNDTSDVGENVTKHLNELENQVISLKEFFKTMKEESSKKEKDGTMNSKLVKFSKKIATLTDDYQNLDQKIEDFLNKTTLQLNFTQKMDNIGRQWPNLVKDVDEFKKSRTTILDVIESQTKSQEIISSLEKRLRNAEKHINRLGVTVKRNRERQDESQRDFEDFYVKISGKTENISRTVDDKISGLKSSYSLSEEEYKDIKSRLERIDALLKISKISEDRPDTLPVISPKLLDKISKKDEGIIVPFPDGFLKNKFKEPL